MSNEELKPCPFCGGDARHLGCKEGFYSEAAICDSCGVNLAPAIWNRRAAPQVAAPGASIDTPEFRDLVGKVYARTSYSSLTANKETATLIAHIDAKLAQRYEAGHLTGYTKAHEEAWTGHEATLKRAEAAEASLARMVNDIGTLRRVEGRRYFVCDDVFALLPAKADKAAVPTRPGITIDRKTFHDMMENYRAAVSEGTARHTYRVTVEFVDLYAAQQREAGYHAGFMDASKPQPDNGG